MIPPWLKKGESFSIWMHLSFLFLLDPQIQEFFVLILCGHIKGKCIYHSKESYNLREYM